MKTYDSEKHKKALGIGSIFSFLIFCIVIYSITKGSLSSHATGTGGKPGITTVTIGETVNYKTSNDKKIQVTVSNLNKQASSNNELVQPKKGRFITSDVTITYTGGGSGTYLVIPTDFSFIGNDGTVYEAELLASAGFHNGMDVLTLNVGQKTQGLVAFDVDASKVEGGKIQLSDFSKAAAFWNV